MTKPPPDAQELLGRVDLFAGMSARQRKPLLLCDRLRESESDR